MSRSILLALFLWGCASSTSPTPPPSANVASIAFTADSLAGDSLPILAGDTTRIAAQALDASGKPVAGVTLVWSSSDTTVATVTSAGVVTAMNPGDADISVSVAARPSANGKVHAKVHPTLIIAPASATTDVGGKVIYIAQAVNAKGVQQWGPVTATWTSSNPSVATISPAGYATGVSPGTTLITGTASVRGKRISATATLVVASCQGITSVSSWNVTISVTYDAGPVSGPSGTGTTFTAHQGSVAKGILDMHVDSEWAGYLTGVANVNNVVIGPKGTNVHETASGASLQSPSVQLWVSTDGPTCYYVIQYLDPATWSVTGDAPSTTVTGPLETTTIIEDLPQPLPDSGWVLTGSNLSVPASTIITVGSNLNSYMPSTGVGSSIAMLYPGATSAQVTYRISQQQ